jgi:hypothetical protein
MSGDPEIDRRNGLWRYSPIIAIFNSALTLAVAGGFITWAIGQEKTDATHTAEISSLKEVNKRQDADIKENRTEFVTTVKEIRDEIRALNEWNKRERR